MRIDLQAILHHCHRLRIARQSDTVSWCQLFAAGLRLSLQHHKPRYYKCSFQLLAHYRLPRFSFSPITCSTTKVSSKMTIPNPRIYWKGTLTLCFCSLVRLLVCEASEDDTELSGWFRPDIRHQVFTGRMALLSLQSIVSASDMTRLPALLSATPPNVPLDQEYLG